MWVCVRVLCFCFYLLVSNHCCRTQCHEKILQRRAREEKRSSGNNNSKRTNARTKHSVFIFQCHDNFNLFENCMLLFTLICRGDLFLHTLYYNSNVFFYFVFLFSSLLFGTCVWERVCVCEFVVANLNSCVILLLLFLLCCYTAVAVDDNDGCRNLLHGLSNMK